MRQIVSKKFTLNDMCKEMKKNQAKEITRILFLPKTKGVCVEWK